MPQVPAGTKRAIKLTGSNLGLIQDVLYNGSTVQPKFAEDKSYMTIVLPDDINNGKPGFYLLTAVASDKAKTQVPVVITIAAPPKPPA